MHSNIFQLTSNFHKVLQLVSIFSGRADSPRGVRILIQPYFTAVPLGIETLKRSFFFFTFLNSVSGQLELHHINTFESTGQKRFLSWESGKCEA